MKKLMIAASAALCAAVGFAIESSNVVGYNSTTLRNGSLGIAPQFEGTASADGSYDLQQIRCNDNASDNVSFTVLTAAGLDTDSYFWVNWYGDEGNESCWVDGDYIKVEGYRVYPGDGFWVAGSVDSDPLAPEADQLFTSAGQVGVKDVSIVLRNGSLMTGNPNPVAIDLQDIICNDPCSDNVSFTVLTAAGLDTDSYFWVNWYGDEGNESCWVDGDYVKVEGYSVAPGLGMWVAGSVDPADPANPDPNTDQIITFPGYEP